MEGTCPFKDIKIFVHHSQEFKARIHTNVFTNNIRATSRNTTPIFTQIWRFIVGVAHFLWGCVTVSQCAKSKVKESAKMDQSTP